ncbi:hypothetical protein [Microvirga makkahensis]|uniref:Cadherin domain-containing protein n=1 Tax=Microvirga makkahensis TaxID=1128670 RepID=A0A7X3MPV9_9HYPH|nr:hypothetical protein [Microvirga makkahensis]MXQ11034.1 hypothetical protein [Microvirga makkahensis]
MATILLSDVTFLETAPAGTVIGTLSIDGGSIDETFTYTLADSLSERFEIKFNAVTGLYELILKTAGGSLFDYETAELKEFSISVSAEGSDGTVVADTAFTVSVNDNTAPTAVALLNTSVIEHAENGMEIGALSVTDPDSGETFTYTLTDDAGGRFDVVDGKIVVKDGSLLDYLVAQSHQITVEVKDSDNNTYMASLTIEVSDVFDFVNGTWKNDRLVGGAGADVIKGFSGNDRLYGLGGNDVLKGGAGKDILFGGSGKDTFVFDTAVKKGHFDYVVDFNPVDDTIQISLAALKAFKVKVAKQEVHETLAGTKAGKAKGFYSLDKVFEKGKLESKFFAKGHARDSYDFVTYDSKTGFVYLDLDGSGRGKGFAIAKLKPGTSVSAGDFLFV